MHEHGQRKGANDTLRRFGREVNAVPDNPAIHISSGSHVIRKREEPAERVTRAACS